uniref:Uncharacterized protein n=1 Tax=Lepeophtheirus salmonis TaxID=72036 RepID=A0A0K2UV10_LEPSM
MDERRVFGMCYECMTSFTL